MNVHQRRYITPMLSFWKKYNEIIKLLTLIKMICHKHYAIACNSGESKVTYSSLNWLYPNASVRYSPDNRPYKNLFYEVVCLGVWCDGNRLPVIQNLACTTSLMLFSGAKICKIRKLTKRFRHFFAHTVNFTIIYACLYPNQCCSKCYDTHWSAYAYFRAKTYNSAQYSLFSISFLLNSTTVYVFFS